MIPNKKELLILKSNPILIFFISALLISCKKENPAEISIVNDYAEKIYYKLDILYDDNIYQIDKKGRCSVLVTNKIYIGDKYFGPFDQVHKAVQKANREAKDSISKSIIQRTTISIKNKKNIYEEVWTFDNEIDTDIGDPKCGNCYGLYETKILLDDGFTKYNNETVYCIKLIFKEIDLGEGAITRTFIYKKDNGIWRLIKRERLNTRDNTFTVNEYAKDYSDYDCDYGNKKNKIKISLSCLLD